MKRDLSIGYKMSDQSSLRKQMDSTASLVLARFIMPILIAIIGAGGSLILFLVWNSLQEVKIDQKTGQQLQWTAIGKINDAETHVEGTIGGLSTQLADHIKAETDIDSELKDIVKDHETRMRILEHPH